MSQVESFKYNYSSTTTAAISFIESTANNTLVSGSVIPVFSQLVEVNTNNTPENGKYSIFEIANWFLLKANMTHKKLQKLCYYAQAWFYTIKGFKLSNADFQAWVHGPVCPVLYERFKGFGYETIKIKINYKPHISEEDIQLLEDVWDTYGDKTGNALEALSHREIPWIEARRGYSDTERCSIVISPESMKRYYRSIYLGEQ